MTLVKIMIDIPLPMPRWVMSSPSHMIIAVPAVRVSDDERHARRREVGDEIDDAVRASCAAVEQEHQAGRLHEGQRDRHVARPLGDLLVADLALLLPRSSCGITTVSSCMMIELVMYGMMPSAKTANLVSAPPENRSMNCRALPPLLRASAAGAFRRRCSEPGRARPAGRRR